MSSANGWGFAVHSPHEGLAATIRVEADSSNASRLTCVLRMGQRCAASGSLNRHDGADLVMAGHHLPNLRSGFPATADPGRPPVASAP